VSVRALLTDRVVPRVAEWETAAEAPRSLYAEFGCSSARVDQLPSGLGARLLARAR